MRIRPMSARALLFTLLSACPVALGQPAGGRTAASYLPADAAIAVGLRGADERLLDFRDWLEDSDYESSPLFKRLEENPQITQARVGLAGLTAIVGADAWTGVGAVLGRDAAVALRPGAAGKPEILAAFVSGQPDLLDRIIKGVHALAGLTKGGEPDPKRVQDVEGVQVYSIAQELLQCRLDDALLLSNNSKMLRDALAAWKAGGDSLQSSGRFRDAMKGVPKDVCVWAVGDLATLRKHVPNLETVEGPRENPAAGYLFGAWWQTLLRADTAVAYGVVGSRHGLTLEARIASPEPLAEVYKGFMPKDQVARWSATELPGYLGEIRIARGWVDLFAERESLLSAAASSQIANFCTTMSTLLGGVDFLNDVLPKLDGPTRLILTRQDFSTRDILPTPKLPAFALVLPLSADAPADFARRLQSGAQTAFSLLSLNFAQEGHPSFILDMDRYRGERELFTVFSAPPAIGGMKMDPDSGGAAASQTAATPASKPASAPASAMVDEAGRAASIRYNFLPAAAIVKNQFIVTTSRELLHAVIDRILAADGQANARTNAAQDRLHIAAAALVEILRDNRGDLVVNRMLEENESKAAAEAFIDTLLDVLAMFQDATIESEVTDTTCRATLTLNIATSENRNVK